MTDEPLYFPSHGPDRRAIVDAHACPRCGAPAGELCRVIDGRGEPLQPTIAVICSARMALDAS
ncbi:MAG: hypothetical protein JWO62_1148 [Acidimicrobiaceae bacterium]|nr:hypothetical protein [Acidimicrobiaceae bacterium]